MEADKGRERKGVVKLTLHSYLWPHIRWMLGIETRSPVSWLSLKHFNSWFYKKNEDIKIPRIIQFSWRKVLARLRELKSTLDKGESTLTRLEIPVRRSHFRKQVWLSCTGEKTLYSYGCTMGEIAQAACSHCDRAHAVLTHSHLWQGAASVLVTGRNSGVLLPLPSRNHVLRICSLSAWQFGNLWCLLYKILC